MISADLYTPNLSILSQKGIALTAFQPDADTVDSLLFRTALEYGMVSTPISYYIAAHPGLGLLRIKSGNLLYSSFPSEHPVSLSDQDFMMFDCHFPYRIMIQAAAEYEILYFSGPSTAYFRTHLLGDCVFRQNFHPDVLLSEVSLLFQRKEINPILCHGLITKLLTTIALEDIPLSHSIPYYLTEIKEELSSQYYVKHTLEELEEKYRINRSRLCREFKNRFQISPMQYLHKMRIQAAKSLLIETDVKIYEISYEVGYENVNHFIHQFKKLVGITPAEYRNKLREM